MLWAVALGCHRPDEKPNPDEKPRATVSWAIMRVDFTTGQGSQVDCATAGVEEVNARYYCLDGGRADWTGPCSQGSVTFDPVEGQICRIVAQGRTAGGWWYFMVGNAHVVVAQGEQYQAQLYRVGRRLQIEPTLALWDGSAYATVASPSCTATGVDYLSYDVVDELGDLKARGQLDCSGDPLASVLPGKARAVSGSGQVEVGNLTLNVHGWRRTDPPTLVMAACPVPVEHRPAASDTFDPYVVPVVLRGPLPASCP